MTEPTSAGVGAGILAGASAGVTGAALAALGITSGLLFWGGVGCVIGAMWAPASGRWRGVATFVAAALLSAKAGAVGALVWWAGSPDVAQGLAAASGVLFHPGVQAVIARLPTIMDKKGL